MRADNPKNNQVITDLSSATKPTQISGADLFYFQAQYYNIRWRDDGTSPTNKTGLLLKANDAFLYTGGSNQLEFITDEETDAAFEISSNFNVKNGKALAYKSAGISVTLSADTVCSTSAGSGKTIATDKWAAMLITGDSNGALTGTWTADADDEASAITLVKALSYPQTQVPIGYVTVLTASGQNWVAGTDALQGGTGGNPSDDTNYYNYRGAQVYVAKYGKTSQ